MDGAAEHEQGRPEKRQRVEEAAGEAVHTGQVTVEDADGPPTGPPPAEQLTAALQKIANHISNSAKFAKASQLLRQVMDAVDKSHRYVSCVHGQQLRSMACFVSCQLGVFGVQLSSYVAVRRSISMCTLVKCRNPISQNAEAMLPLTHRLQLKLYMAGATTPTPCSSLRR